MITTSPHNSGRFGLRLLSRTRVLSAVLALAAFAVSSARADVIFSRTTATGEHWALRTATFTPAYSGNYTLAFNLTAGGPSGDNSIIIDAVKVTNGATTLFADGFENPGLGTNTGVSANGGTATFGAWMFNNYSGILNGSPSSWDLAGPASLPSGSPFTLGSADGTSQYAYLQAAGGLLPTMKASSTLALVAGQTYTVSFYQASRYSFGGTTTYTVTLDAPVPVVFASGYSPIIAWDPIFLNGPVPDYSESKPVPTVGYSDPRWSNPHSASVFAKGTHPWEFTPPMNFDAYWINAWSNINSNGHGKSLSSWPNYYPYFGVPDQSFTKYSTTVYGQGDFVLQFLADNVSWIYIDGTLVGYQDYWWPTSATGRYTVTLNGAGSHELSFVIWDGGGAAGGKFRLETRASFEANNPGVSLPPRTAAVTLSNLTQTYDGTPKSVAVSTSPGGLTTSVTYNGSTTAPTAAGTYAVVATVTSSGYAGSNSGTLTITKAPVTFTLGNLNQTYDGTAKSITVTPSPANVAYAVNYLGDHTNAGSTTVQVVSTNSNYNGSASDTLVINKANATVAVSGSTTTYDATAHGATGTAKGVGGVTLGGLNLGATFTNVPGGTAHWTFTGGQNYNDQAGDVAIVINKADAVVNVTGYSGTYDGAAHGASGSAKGVNNVDLSAGLNLGLTFKNAPGGTASWSFAGGQNYNDQNGSVGIAIAKANATVVVNPYNVTYDAQPHSATVASIAGVAGETGATVGSVSLSTTHTDAGSYADSWSFTGGQNYNDIGATPITNTIAKANATVTVKGYTGTYDAAAHGASGTASGVGGVDLSAGLNLGASFTDFPGGTANWSFSGGTNYNDQTGSAAIVINKADALINIGSYTGTYDGAPHALTGTATGVGGVDLSSGLNFGASFTNFPGGTANWAFSGGINYNDAGGSAQVTINKAASVTTTLGAGPFTYNGSAYAGGSGTVTGAGGLSTAATSLTYAGNQIDAGSYTVTAHYAGDNNHTASDGAPVTITINKASSTTTTIGAGPFTYNGSAYAGGSGTVTGAGGLSTAATSLTYSGDQVNAGSYTVTANYAGDANHEPSTGSPVTITINKADARLSVNGYSGVYDGAAHGATGTATGVGGASVGTFNLGATFTNAPGGTANWTFSGGQNYNDANGTAAIVISKANAIVTVNSYTAEFDGLPHSATVASITGVAGETGATVGSVTLNSTHTAVGNYADTWSFTGTGNYNNTSGAMTDKIVDTTAPVITTISTNAPTLWPPNHKMVAVTVSALASDLVGVTSLKIVSVTSSEPDNGLGDGDTANDIQVTGNLTVNLRAERSGRGNGRTYTITVEAKDAAGNASTRTVTVSVPKDQSDKDDDKKSEDKKGDDKKSEVKSENKKSDDKKDK